MDRLIQAIVNYSKVEVISYDICKATATSFVTSIESRITGTGPVYGSILAMPLDATGPAGNFATLAVDDTKITPSGATVSVVSQKIQITDMTAFLAFIRTIMQEDTCEMSLFAKSATIKALMIRKTIEFSKTAEVIGWKGLKGEFVNIKSGKAVVKIVSTSQTSIDLGVAEFEVQDKSGVVVAKMKGPLKVEKGETFHELDMSFTPGLDSQAQVGDVVKLLGVSATPETWLNDAIKFFGVDVVVGKEWMDAMNS